MTEVGIRKICLMGKGVTEIDIREICVAQI